MTAKESKAVAWQWHTGGPQFCTPEDKAKRLAAGDGFAKGYTIPLVPLSLLAEAESALKNAQENEDIEYALRGEAESRIAALQSRLDAVAGLARYDISTDYESRHAVHMYACDDGDYVKWDDLRAALGCATTGEGGQ